MPTDTDQAAPGVGPGYVADVMRSASDEVRRLARTMRLSISYHDEAETWCVDDGDRHESRSYDTLDDAVDDVIRTVVARTIARIA